MPFNPAAPNEVIPKTTITKSTERPLKNWKTSGAALPSAVP